MSIVKDHVASALWLRALATSPETAQKGKAVASEAARMQMSDGGLHVLFEGC